MYSGNLYFTHLNIHFAFLVIPSIYPSISAFIPSILFIPSIPSIHPSLPVFIHLCIHFLHSVYFMFLFISCIPFIYSLHSSTIHACMHSFIHSIHSIHLSISSYPIYPFTCLSIHSPLSPFIHLSKPATPISQ